MVKDLFREIKSNYFQFIALVLITALGVGFFVGIQVTGYDMRQTADHYMDTHRVLDYQIQHTLGIDDAMIEEIETLLGGNVEGILDDTVFARSDKVDDVLKVYAYTDVTKRDVTLIEGSMPQNDLDVLADVIMKQMFDLEVGDTLQIFEHNVFETTEVKVVGFIESSMYLNLDRGQSQLGVGKVNGFIYGLNLPVVNDDIYTAIRIQDASVDDVVYFLDKHKDMISENRFNRAIVPELEKLADAQVTLDEARLKAEAEFSKAEQEFENAKKELDAAYVQLEDGVTQLSGGFVLSGTVEERIGAARINFGRIKTLMENQLEVIRVQIAQTENEEVKEVLEKQLDEGVEELRVYSDQFESGMTQLERGLVAYNEGLAEYERNLVLYESEKASAIQELDDAQKEIDRGYEAIENADHGTMIVSDREAAIIGYREFYDDSMRIEKIGKVFPVIFFFVAILVTLSTMSRLIEENRMEMGVYKALGYSPLRTSMKYILFSGLSWVIGSLIGLYFGFFFIPQLIYDAYRIMYQTPELVDGVIWQYTYIPLMVGFLSSVGVTFIKSMKISKETTANLLRPQPPKSGQRILLERFTGLWKRLSFLYKVSFRNLFRNKSRFFMTLLGIGGTTGLLIVGIGLRHSIYSIVDKQFDEIIQYDGLVYYVSDEFENTYFEDALHMYVEGIELDHFDVSIYSTDDLKQLSEFVQVRDRKSGVHLDYDYDDVILTEKIARKLELDVGDTFSLRVDGINITLQVGAIMETYAGHSIYLSHQTLEAQLGYVPQENIVLFKTDATNLDALATEVLEDENVVAIQFLDELSETYRDMMKNFDVVVWVVIGAAIALEVLVLINLITMNMNERQKELATLKVLGFNKNELASYILRENIILTLMAIIFGFAFGKILHYFVVTQAEIDVVMFNYEILISSYLYAFVLTFGLSVLINFLMARRANTVNMSEALKTFDE